MARGLLIDANLAGAARMEPDFRQGSGMQELVSYPEGIYAVDSGYMRTQLAAIHLIRSGDQVAIVDTGNNDSVPRVMAALATLGLDA